MDLLPLEFAKLDRPPASGLAPGGGSVFYEELRRAERDNEEDVAPAEPEHWEPAERTEPPKREHTSEEVRGPTGPDRSPSRGDERTAENNGAEAEELAKYSPTGIAAPIEAQVTHDPAAAERPAGFGPPPAHGLALEVAGQVRPVVPNNLAKTSTHPSAGAATGAASSSTAPTLGDAPQAGVRGNGARATGPHPQRALQPLPGPAPATTPAAPAGTLLPPAQSPEPPPGNLETALSLQMAPQTKAKTSEAAGTKRGKSGPAAPATIARKAMLQGKAAELKNASVTGASIGADAHQAKPAEGAGGGAFTAFVNAATFAASAGAPGPGLNALGLAAPNAVPQSGGAVDPIHSDSRTAARGGPAVEQIAVRIQVAAKQGQDHINIRLHPADLGRVEVKLDLTEDGPLRAVLIAERSDTLELLQRDAGQLERSLAQAGLKLDSGSLNFGLQNQANDGDGTRETGSAGAEPDHSEAGNENRPVPDGRWSTHDGVLDLVV